MENLDMISNLPEPILQHIMSFLSFKRAAQTSVLSKLWQQAWHTFPVLEFDHRVFNDDLRFYGYFKGDDTARKNKVLKLFDYMAEALRNRHKQMIRIKKFAFELFLISPLPQEFEPFIDQCVFYAIESDVKDLTLKVPHETVPKNWQYQLPQVALFSKSINVLRLSGCKLESPTNARLSSLSELSLSVVNVTDQALENLLIGCPLIEILSVHQCQGFQSLELFGHSNLSDITISNNKGLKRLVIEGLSVRSFALGGPSHIPDEVNVASCKNLKSMQISMVTVTDKWLSDQISNFPLLECLRIGMCGMLTSFKISSLHLKRLDISDCDKLGEVKIETPNLRIFIYEGDIISFTSDALTLSETELNFHTKNMDTQWYFKYVELIARFHSFSKVLNLQSWMGENLIIPKEVRQIHPSPLCNVEHLNIVVTPIGGLAVAVIDAIDGLLWMSPHAKTILIEPHSFDYENYFFKFKFSYKRPPVYEGGIAQCCKSCCISCWQQCIEEVEIEYCNGKATEDGKDVKRYNLKGEGIWEKINSLADLGSYHPPVPWSSDYLSHLDSE